MPALNWPPVWILAVPGSGGPQHVWSSDGGEYAAHPANRAVNNRIRINWIIAP
jgi:hypothetical protein